MKCIEVGVSGIYKQLHTFGDDFAQELAKMADSIKGMKLYTMEDFLSLYHFLNYYTEFTYHFTNGGTTLEVELEEW